MASAIGPCLRFTTISDFAIVYPQRRRSLSSSSMVVPLASAWLPLISLRSRGTRSSLVISLVIGLWTTLVLFLRIHALAICMSLLLSIGSVAGLRLKQSIILMLIRVVSFFIRKFAAVMASPSLFAWIMAGVLIIRLWRIYQSFCVLITICLRPITRSRMV